MKVYELLWTDEEANANRFVGNWIYGSFATRRMFYQ